MPETSPKSHAGSCHALIKVGWYPRHETPLIQRYRGDLFDSTAHAFAHNCHTAGRMGAGIRHQADLGDHLGPDDLAAFGGQAVGCPGQHVVNLLFQVGDDFSGGIRGVSAFRGGGCCWSSQRYLWASTGRHSSWRSGEARAEDDEDREAHWIPARNDTGAVVGFRMAGW